MPSIVKAQDGPGINAGIGLPEGINFGMQLPLVQNQLQFGTYIGSFTSDDSDESYLSISGDVFYHSAGTSSHSELRPWYTRANLNYVRSETENDLNKYLLSNLRIGRQLHISNRFIIELDGGIALRLYKDETPKEDSGSNWFNIDFDLPAVIPSGGLRLVYQF